jgi:formylglycine-generating enzyme required for sulfatase activity
MLLGVLAWLKQDYLWRQFQFYTVTRPYIRSQIFPYALSAATEQALRPGDSFRECARDCPEMLVVPEGSFMMGSSADEAVRALNEGPHAQGNDRQTVRDIKI